jgi:SAM-dependent methyltransferase
MTGDDELDRASWDRRWTQVSREHPDKLAERRANAHLVTETAHLRPGRALDAGCGHGAEALWLASRGWRVTAVDYSVAALAIARSRAGAVGADVAERIEWTEGDLTTWAPPPGCYQLVISLYVHVAGSVGEMVGRLGAGVAPGGTLLLVGHRPIDPTTGAPTAAAGQVQVSVDAASRLSTLAAGGSRSPRSDSETRPVRVSTRWCARSRPQPPRRPFRSDPIRRPRRPWRGVPPRARRLALARLPR